MIRAALNHKRTVGTRDRADGGKPGRADRGNAMITSSRGADRRDGGAQRRSNPAIGPSVFWIASLRAQ
jgi:hypothetical protein